MIIWSKKKKTCLDCFISRDFWLYLDIYTTDYSEHIFCMWRFSPCVQSPLCLCCTLCFPGSHRRRVSAWDRPSPSQGSTAAAGQIQLSAHLDPNTWASRIPNKHTSLSDPPVNMSSGPSSFSPKTPCPCCWRSFCQEAWESDQGSQTKDRKQISAKLHKVRKWLCLHWQPTFLSLSRPTCNLCLQN